MDSEKEIRKIAETLKELRKRAGYTSAESFSYDKGLPRNQYWRLENGTTNPTVKSLIKVLKVHQLTLAEFFKLANV